MTRSARRPGEALGILILSARPFRANRYETARCDCCYVSDRVARTRIRSSTHPMPDIRDGEL